MLGREAELAAARALLLCGDTGLLTLTGAGGSGKTRLALAVADGLRDDFPGGVVFVPLAGVADLALVLPGVARAVGVPDASTTSLMARLLDTLRPSRALLLLDNFEHLIEAAPQVAELVTGVPSLKILATSRMPLRVRDEQVMPVPPLALPDEGDGVPADLAMRSPAVALFVACVRRMRPSFVPDAEDVGAIAEICRRLDGLPLAIELAAARCAFLSPQALLGRLGRRLDLLDVGPQDLPDRQRTLRHAIAWSYGLLNSREQYLFRQLAVFAGDVTPEALAPVAGPQPGNDAGALDDIASLVEKNLLQRADGPDGEPRLRMLETVREFALEQLETCRERDWAQRRHAAYVLAAAEAIPDDRGRSWLERMDDLQADIRAVLRWALGTDERALAVRLVWRLMPYWFFTGQLNEGRAWAEQVVTRAAAAGDQDTRARALSVAGMFVRTLGDLELARGWLEEAAELARGVGDPAARGTCLAILGQWAKDQGELAAARRIAGESVDLLRGTGEPWLLGLSLSYFGAIAECEGALDEARSLYTEALQHLRGCGIPAAVSRP